MDAGVQCEISRTVMRGAVEVDAGGSHQPSLGSAFRDEIMASAVSSSAVGDASGREDLSSRELNSN